MKAEHILKLLSQNKEEVVRKIVQQELERQEAYRIGGIERLRRVQLIHKLLNLMNTSNSIHIYRDSSSKNIYINHHHCVYEINPCNEMDMIEGDCSIEHRAVSQYASDSSRLLFKINRDKIQQLLNNSSDVKDKCLRIAPYTYCRVDDILKCWCLLGEDCDMCVTDHYAVVYVKGRYGQGYIRLCTPDLPILNDLYPDIQFIEPIENNLERSNEHEPSSC